MFSFPNLLSIPGTAVRQRAASDSASLVQSQQQQPDVEKNARTNEQSLAPQDTNTSDPEGQIAQPAENDVFGNEEGAEVHYKTCKW